MKETMSQKSAAERLREKLEEESKKLSQKESRPGESDARKRFLEKLEEVGKKINAEDGGEEAILSPSPVSEPQQKSQDPIPPRPFTDNVNLYERNEHEEAKGKKKNWFKSKFEQGVNWINKKNKPQRERIEAWEKVKEGPVGQLSEKAQKIVYKEWQTSSRLVDGEDDQQNIDLLTTDPIAYFKKQESWYEKDINEEKALGNKTTWEEKELKKIKEKLAILQADKKNTATVPEKKMTEPKEEKRKIELTDAGEVRLEKRLVAARKDYADKYKEFLERTGTLKSIHIDDYERLRADLKLLEEKYDKAAAELGREMERNGVDNHIIFKKIIIEEQEALNELKAENFPPKEKGILRKGLDFWVNMGKTKKGQVARWAISFTLSAGLTAATAGIGGGAWLGLKAVRSIGGLVAGKSIGKIVKSKFDTTEEDREQLKTKTGSEFEIDNFDEFKKTYIDGLNSIEKRKRRIELAAMGAGILAGGLTNLGVGVVGGYTLPMSGNVAEHSTSPKATPTPEPTKTPAPTPDISSKIPPKPDGSGSVAKPTVELTKESVAFKPGKGAIWGISELKKQIATQYPDGKYPSKSMEEFMKEPDDIKQAMRLRLYDSSSSKESALIGKDSVLQFDKEGNLVLHNTATGKADVLINKDGSLEKYDGKMLDSDKPSVQETSSKTTHIEPNTKTKVSPTLEKEFERKEVPLKDVPEQESAPEGTPKSTPTPEITQEEKINALKADIEEKLSGGEKSSQSLTKDALLEKYPQYRGTEFENNPQNLPEAELVERYKAYEKTYGEVKAYLQESEDDKAMFEFSKNAPAENFIGEKGEAGDRLTPYINKLATQIREPVRTIPGVRTGEKVGEYIDKVIQEQALKGKEALDKVKPE